MSNCASRDQLVTAPRISGGWFRRLVGKEGRGRNIVVMRMYTLLDAEQLLKGAFWYPMSSGYFNSGVDKRQGS